MTSAPTCTCQAGQPGDQFPNRHAWDCPVVADARRRAESRLLPYTDTCFVTDADGVTRRLSAAVRVF